MYYPDAKEYITFVFSLLDEFAEKNKLLSAEGDPRRIQMLP